VDLNAVVEGMQDLLDSALGSKVRLALRPAADLWPAMVDQTQIELVILNLVINARDAMPDGGVVTVETRNQPAAEPKQSDEKETGAYVVVVVRDTGTGMTPEVKAKAFEPFFTTKAPGAGSGLGLSQVFGTARQSGGEVQIDTELGQGTAVSVLLPRATPAGPEEPVADSQEGQGSGATVLLVDDDEPVRTVTAAMLRDLGYSVREAAGGAEALDALSNDIGVDVLLTDLAMPEMNGAQLAKAAQARQPELAVVFLSGYADTDSFARGAVMRHLVRKPFRPGELRQQIEAALSDRG
jgi:CheY-like chemotaxis protein